MSTSFSTTTTVAGSPAEVFAAVLNTSAWWNTAIEGRTTHVGDEFGFEVAGLHRTRIRVTEATPSRRLEWLVVENNFGFVTDQSEWVGDRMVFDFEPVEAGTKVTFTQHGLVPELECFDVCSNAWGFFIGASLRQLAEEGQGSPETNAGQAAPAERARAAADALRDNGVTVDA